MNARIAVNVTLHLQVHDPKAFARAARKRAVADGLTSFADLRDYHSGNLTDCARMLFDPGLSPPGCSILDSSADEDTTP